MPEAGPERTQYAWVLDEVMGIKPSDGLEPDCEGPFRFYHPVGEGRGVLKKLRSIMRFEIKNRSSSEELKQELKSSCSLLHPKTISGAQEM